ncbi:MAG: enoyl-CoA hydratase-related protein [Gemmatimonadota bacterium]|jgi:enoyl-CoA hydratase/carnithine racemase
MSTIHPHLTIDGPIARIVLDRPDRHNALELADLQRFRAHLAEVDKNDRIRVLVVTGSGEATFCAGASLDQLESGEISGRIFETLTTDLASSRVPTICALNGSAYGGGAEIALCCDFRIGVVGSRISVPAARLGVCYPVTGLRRYLASLGPGVARRIMLAAEELDADEMLRSGFLDRLVRPEELSTVAAALADHMAGLAPLAVQAMKRILRGLALGTLDDDDAQELVSLCEGSEDLKEGLRARRERRPAEFRGR